MKSKLLILILFYTVSLSVTAKEMTKTTDIKNIIMSAFFAKDGITERILEGEIAENIRNQIKRPGTTVLGKH